MKKENVGGDGDETDMETELSLAVNLQRSILPPFAGLEKDFAWCFMYSPYARVSGDVFEMIRLGENERVLVFGDLTGHGIHSAMAMVAVQAYLKCYRFGEERADLPWRLAADLSRYLWSNLRGRIYMSGVVVHWDGKENALRMFNAGHNDLLCIGAEGKSRPVNPEKRGGVPMGLTPDAEFDEGDVVEFRFRDDDVFVICSDGMLELSKDAAGNECAEPGFFEAAAEDAVAEARETGKWVVFPFLLHDKLARGGYVHAHDDLLLAGFSKREAIAGSVRYNDYNHCTRQELGKSAERLAEWVREEYGEETAERVGRVARARIGTILGHGFGADVLEEESVSVNVVDEGETLLATLWDYGEEYRSEGEVEEAERAGAVSVDGRRLAGKLNEFSFRLRKSRERS